MDLITYPTDPTMVATPLARHGRFGVGRTGSARWTAEKVAPLAADVAGHSPVLTAGTAGMVGIRPPRGAPL